MKEYFIVECGEYAACWNAWWEVLDIPRYQWKIGEEPHKLWSLDSAKELMYVFMSQSIPDNNCKVCIYKITDDKKELVCEYDKAEVEDGRLNNEHRR